MANGSTAPTEETAERLDDNTALQIATIAGVDRPDLGTLDALEKPVELSRLRDVVDRILPTRVPFSEVLLEVCSWTGFAEGFTISASAAPGPQTCTSACARSSATQSPSSAGSPRRLTSSAGSTAKSTAARPASASTATKPATASLGSSSTATRAGCAGPIATAKKSQLGALGFALNALVLWNAQYMHDAIDHLGATGHRITDADLQRRPRSPTSTSSCDAFPFTLPHALGGGRRRPLRQLGDPA